VDGLWMAGGCSGAREWDAAGEIVVGVVTGSGQAGS
jgi:hypothetical protein